MCVGTAYAQFGGIVYDPTNYANAVLRYNQLVQQLTQLRQTYAQIVQQYNLAVRMAQNLQKHARPVPGAVLAVEKCRSAKHLRQHWKLGQWHEHRSTGNREYRLSAGHRSHFSNTTARSLGAMTPDELNRVKSQYASVELSDGANVTAMAAIGAIRDNAQTIQNQINNLEQDTLSDDPNLNSEVSVLNKINAANVLTLRTLQDSNKLLVSLLEQNVVAAKQQREATANSINTDISPTCESGGESGPGHQYADQLAPELPHALIYP